MTSLPKFIYVLSLYGNQENLKTYRTEVDDIYRIKYDNAKGIIIELSEINSLIDDRFSLTVRSARYELDLFEQPNISKDASIQNHPTKIHPWKHLQFTLEKGLKKIRIKIDGLDRDDYERCIKGFLYISQEIIDIEKKELKIKDNLQNYFFNDVINELASDRVFLLDKIKFSHEKGDILNDSNIPLTDKELEDIKKENHLLPFFKWD